MAARLFKLKDKREVTVVATIHDDSFISKRRLTGTATSSLEDIQNPHAVIEYSEYMVGLTKWIPR